MNALKQDSEALYDVEIINVCAICDKVVKRRVRQMREDDIWDIYPNHIGIIDGMVVVDSVEVMDFCCEAHELKYYEIISIT